MFDEQLPSKEDLNLLSKISNQGSDMIEDLYSIFSYQRPKEYKIYVDHIEYNPLDKDKIILDLIFTIQKYNKLVSKQMAIYKLKGKKTKYFFDLYKGSKYFGKSVTSRTCGEILSNLIPKYEEKHIRFKPEFLKKNIFNDSALLDYKLNDDIDFFNSEVRKNGANSYKSVKYIKFIEKLYKLIQRAFQRMTINSTAMLYENQHDILIERQQDKILRLNQMKMLEKEIKFDKKEIEKLKKLNDIANIAYNQIMEDINKKNIRTRTKTKTKKKDKDADKSKEKKDINEDTEINNKNINEETKININSIINEETNFNNNIINENNNDNNINEEKIEEKGMESKINTRYNENYNKTVLTQDVNKKLTFYNHGTTASTGFIDTKNTTLSNNFTFYNSKRELIDKLNKLKIRKEKEKQREKEKYKHLPINIRTLPRKKSNNFFPKINEQKTNIKLLINPVLNASTKILPKSESAPSLFDIQNKKLNLESIKENNNIDSESKNEKININSLSTKRKILRNKEKMTKAESLYEKKKKIPIIYEQLRKIKNLLNMPRRDIEQKSKVYQLFTELYDKNKIINVDEKKAPKELYNTYFNMRLSIEKKNYSRNMYKKYRNMLTKSTEDILGKIKEQDEKLKTKYYDLAQIMVKKKLENENEKFANIA